MKQTFHLSMTWLHRWSGLIFGWALYVIALTGTIVVFSDEITAWMQPELPSEVVPIAEAVATAEHHLRRVAPHAENWSIMPSADHGAVSVAWHGAASGSLVLDARDGTTIAPRDTHGAEPLVDLHFRLHSGPIGMWIVAGSGMVMLLGLLTGVIIHRRIFRDFFTFRPGKGQRTWLDAHNMAGVTTLPFQVFIAFTGLMIFPVLLMPGALAVGYGGDRAAYVADWYTPTQRAEAGRPAQLVPLGPLLDQAGAILRGEVVQVSVAHPGDAAAVVTFHRAIDDRLSMMADWAAFDGADGRLLDRQVRYPPGIEVSGVMVGLHFAKFGGAWVRGLYFFSGLASTVLIATGLVLWAVKRRSRAKAGARGLRLVDALNLAVIAGLPLAITAYFAANRLLPIGLAERGEWETRILFATWAASAVWAAARSGRASWAAMLLLTAVILTAVVIADLALPGGAGFVMPAILGATAVSGAAAALAMHRKVPA